jgi:hypothetical protein
MGFVYLAVAAIFAVLTLSTIYMVLPHRSLPDNKPNISFFPKYFFPISNEKARLNLKSIGFHPHKNSDIYVRGYYLGDFSARMAYLSVILDGNTAYLQSPLMVIFFDTGVLWKIAKEVQGTA